MCGVARRCGVTVAQGRGSVWRCSAHLLRKQLPLRLDLLLQLIAAMDLQQLHSLCAPGAPRVSAAALATPRAHAASPAQRVFAARPTRAGRAQARSLQRGGSASGAERPWGRQAGATGACSASDPEKLNGVPALVMPLLGTNGLSVSLGPPNSLPPPCFSAGCGCGRARKAKSVLRTLMCDPAARRVQRPQRPLPAANAPCRRPR